MTLLLPLGLRLLFKLAVAGHPRHPPGTTETSPVCLLYASYTGRMERCQERGPQWHAWPCPPQVCGLKQTGPALQECPAHRDAGGGSPACSVAPLWARMVEQEFLSCLSAPLAHPTQLRTTVPFPQALVWGSVLGVPSLCEDRNCMLRTSMEVWGARGILEVGWGGWEAARVLPEAQGSYLIFPEPCEANTLLFTSGGFVF